jgi:hypothetical protein
MQIYHPPLFCVAVRRLLYPPLPVRFAVQARPSLPPPPDALLTQFRIHWQAHLFFFFFLSLKLSNS